MQLSILDRANAIEGISESDTLHGVLDHARHVEKLGFTRFFTAEHHAVPGLPGSQPTMLATAVGAATSTIRVGTAGIMLPAHQPLIVAEQIATLEALYPGRVDAGIGNSVGFTTPVRAALGQTAAPRQTDSEALRNLKAEYPDELRELLRYLDGEAAITARPFNNSATPVWLLAGFRSLLLAAELGLPVIAGGINADASRQYVDNFQPSPRAAAPQLAVSRTIAVADTEDAAKDLVLPEIYAQVKARSSGSFDALKPVADIRESDLTAQEKQRITNQLKLAIYGTPGQVASEIKKIKQYATEIVVTGGMSNIAGQQRSEELLAELVDDL